MRKSVDLCDREILLNGLDELRSLVRPKCGRKPKRRFRLNRLFVGMFMITIFLFFWSLNFSDGSGFDELNAADYCDKEKFVYTHLSSASTMLRAKKFDCKLLPLLKHFNLTEDHHLPQRIPFTTMDDLVFVGAADSTYFRAMLTTLSTIRRNFGTKPKFILYDLGRIQTTFPKEIQNLCNTEIRKFNFTKLHISVRGIKSFSWKIWILAEIFNEYQNAIYVDSSIYFQSSDFEVFFEKMAEHQLTPLQLSGDTGHGLRFATDSRTYEFIPLDPAVGMRSHMFEANLILLHRDELTRQTLKWAFLCGNTAECIIPAGSSITCPVHNRQLESACHRQDQSVLNILLYNQEYTLRRQRVPVLQHGNDYHPKNLRQRHETRRYQHERVQNIYNCSSST